MELCEQCQNFDIQAFSRNDYPVRGLPAAAVKKSAEAGCDFCSFLVQILPEIADAWPSDRWLKPEQHSGLFAMILVALRLLLRFGEWLIVGSGWILLRARRDTQDNASDDEGLRVLALEAYVSTGVEQSTNIQVAADAGELAP